MNSVRGKVNWIAPIPQLLSSDTLRDLESSKCNPIGIDVRKINHRCSLIRHVGREYHEVQSSYIPDKLLASNNQPFKTAPSQLQSSRYMLVQPASGFLPMPASCPNRRSSKLWSKGTGKTASSRRSFGKTGTKTPSPDFCSGFIQAIMSAHTRPHSRRPKRMEKGKARLSLHKAVRWHFLRGSSYLTFY